MKYSLASAAVYAGLLCGQTAQQSPQDLLKEAIALQQQGKLDEAIRDYEQFLDMYPKVAEVRSNLAAALVGTGRYAEAIAEYQRALETKPDAGVRLNLALAYYKAAEYGKAAEELDKVHAAEPSNMQALLLLADCNLRRGRNKQVIDLLRPVFAADPGNLGADYLLGTALARDGQADQAQPVINRITSRGDSAEVRLLMGTAKFTGHDYQAALDDLKKAVEMNPKLPDVYSYYGMALLLTGDQEGAKQAFEKELQNNPNNFEANLRMGLLLRNDQEYDRALPYLDRALNVRPGDLGVRFQIASAQLGQGKEQQARAELEQIVKEAPTFVEAHVTLATIYYREKHKDLGDRERGIVDKLNAQRQAKQVEADPTR